MPVPGQGGEQVYEACLQRLPLQRKLAVGAADDPLEREADDMAARVMRMPDTAFIQRKCAHCEEEEKAQRKPLTPFIQKRSDDTGGTADSDVSERINATRGGGQGMPEETRSFMESRMNADFSSVRIHTGDYAASLSQQLNAQAFTVGNDIYFNEGRFSPGSDDGKHLLAHELTHTIQQGGSISRQIQRTPRPPARVDCPSRPNDFIRLVVVNQETPQTVSIFWNNSGTVETARCSSGKGGCCIPASAPDNAVGCTEAQSAVNGSNCTQIGTFTVNSVQRQSSSGVDFWTQFIGSPRFIALHEYTPVDGTPLSHGCVRMDHDMAVKIYCGAIAGATRVEVRGFARPRCSNATLVNEWINDFSGATPRNDGDPSNRELRSELIHHMGLGRGEDAQQALDTRIAGMRDPTTQAIDPALGAAAIPRCSGVSGLGTEIERLQRTNPSMLNQTAATAFRTNLGLAANLRAATAAVQQAGTDLWTSAHGSTTAGRLSVDDRPLYWTRNFIIRELQEWHPTFSLTTAQRNTLISTFERASRGLDVTSFAAVDPGVKRILITGFDPFGLDNTLGRPGAMSGLSVGNPSGAIVLALDGQTISGAHCQARIQGAIFPVRYRDFDAGVVEQYVRNFTSGANAVDMIMTISRNADNGIFELERFAARARGSGLDDNEGATSTQADLDRSLSRIHGRGGRSDEFTESTLPRAGMSAPPRVVQDDSYSGHVPGVGPVDQTTNATPPANAVSDSGSGGSFLSNEIFYRVSLLQLNQQTSIPMGHLHVPAGTQAQYPFIVNTVRQIITRALDTSLCPS